MAARASATDRVRQRRRAEVEEVEALGTWLECEGARRGRRKKVIDPAVRATGAQRASFPELSPDRGRAKARRTWARCARVCTQRGAHGGRVHRRARARLEGRQRRWGRSEGEGGGGDGRGECLGVTKTPRLGISGDVAVSPPAERALGCRPVPSFFPLLPAPLLVHVPPRRLPPPPGAPPALPSPPQIMPFCSHSHPNLPSATSLSRHRPSSLANRHPHLAYVRVFKSPCPALALTDPSAGSRSAESEA